ncbi:ferrochelatase [Pseudochelatococcus lubricantis]|uniref:Ferrochelatase n=1 Tax=Pseudochelatococcus lubricantis TaxID=1538102 RepID=A0ABX0V5H3_9HYPH|nr:ferrochelatase [Pseudochelatococcus lubricantis]NIJ58371.1 ferrochelatase [Pseudochelatococcus lubricantis]
MPPAVAPTAPAADEFPVFRSGRIGVLLLNLGTPEATDYWSMRRYLKEFLSDRRVIEIPRLIWWPVLNLIVLTKRPGPKGRDYESIWNRERNESPLKTITRSQSEKLAEIIAGGAPEQAARITVDWAMRYGLPDVRSRLQFLQDQGCDRILLVPLYPQYAAATSATACDKAFEALMTMRWQPTIRVAPPYSDEPVYIDALATSLRQALASLDFEPEKILASFHGVPKSYILKGDPYRSQCLRTHALLCEAMGLAPDRLLLTFQSRFGTEEWLTPYTDETVKGLAQSGVKRLAIITPGFSADCLETLEEIGVENRDIFLQNGGERFAAIPCLNDTPEGMAVIAHVVRRELRGWIDI